MNNFVNHSLWLEYLLPHEYLKFRLSILFLTASLITLLCILFCGETSRFKRRESLQIVHCDISHLTFD